MSNILPKVQEMQGIPFTRKVWAFAFTTDNRDYILKTLAEPSVYQHEGKPVLGILEPASEGESCIVYMLFKEKPFSEELSLAYITTGFYRWGLPMDITVKKVTDLGVSKQSAELIKEFLLT